MPRRLVILPLWNSTALVDTCIVVTPILPAGGGVLLTNSGKFAHYAPSLIGYDVIFVAAAFMLFEFVVEE